MTTVKLSVTGNIDLSQVFIDDVLVLTGTGEASFPVEDSDADYALTWFMRGQPGSTYELKVTAPKAAKFTHKAPIDSSTKDAGLYWFRVR